jgi:hypothetical protein
MRARVKNKNGSEDFKNYLLGLSALISSILVPFVGYLFSQAEKDKELAKSYTEIGIKILSSAPADSIRSDSLRVWAVDLINHYSEIKFSNEARNYLINKGSIFEPGEIWRHLPSFSMLKVRPVEVLRSDAFHVQLLVEDKYGKKYQASINVMNFKIGQKTQYLIDKNYIHPVCGRLLQADLDDGLNKSGAIDKPLSIDYIRYQHLDFATMKTDTLLPETLMQELRRAIANKYSVLYIFGNSWDDTPTPTPGRVWPTVKVGIHDIHM